MTDAERLKPMQPVVPVAPLLAQSLGMLLDAPVPPIDWLIPGLSEGDALAAMMDWNQTCSPPWDADDLEAKLRNAARYGTGGFGSKNVEAPRPSGLRWA